MRMCWHGHKLVIGVCLITRSFNTSLWTLYHPWLSKPGLVIKRCRLMSSFFFFYTDPADVTNYKKSTSSLRWSYTWKLFNRLSTVNRSKSMSSKKLKCYFWQFTVEIWLGHRQMQECVRSLLTAMSFSGHTSKVRLYPAHAVLIWSIIFNVPTNARYSLDNTNRPIAAFLIWYTVGYYARTTLGYRFTKKITSIVWCQLIEVQSLCS